MTTTSPAGRLILVNPELATRARRRLIAGMAGLVAEDGLRAMTVGGVCRRAGMSRRTFYDVFDDLDECFAAGVAQAFAELRAGADTAAAATTPGEPWEARAARIVTALVAAFARDGTLAHLCLVEARLAGPAGHAVRRDALAHLARTLADGATLDDDALRHTTARGTIIAVLELADERRRRSRGSRSDDLAASAVYLALVPFSGRRVASAWSQRTAAAPPPSPPPLPSRGAHVRPQHQAVNVTQLTRRTLLHLDAHPGASNVDIARAVGVAHQSQISRHLARLEREGVALRQRAGRSNAWRLTASGHSLARGCGDRDAG